jgi:hypothetical protein
MYLYTSRNAKGVPSTHKTGTVTVTYGLLRQTDLCGMAYQNTPNRKLPNRDLRAFFNSYE